MGMTDLTSLADRRWRSLSGGEQQRLSLAIALCGGTDLLMLDEPTAAVDVEGRDRILDLITELGRSGSTILLTTHRFEDVDRLASRVVMIDRGRIVAAEHGIEASAIESGKASLEDRYRSLTGGDQ